jgi:hypothetical protein
MIKSRISKLVLIIGMLTWLWNIFAPDKLGGYLYLFTNQFSISNLKYGVLWDAAVFLIVGALALRFEGSNKLWWLELGLLLSYVAKFVVQLFQQIVPPTLVTSLGFLLFVAHFVTQGNPKRRLQVGNLPVDRITSFLALIPLGTLILGWSLPFDKNTYQTNGKTTFSWNGKYEISTTCCTAFESDWQSNVISLSRYFWMFILLLTIIIGVKVSKAVFVPALIFSFYDVVNWISGLGMQKVQPDQNWTQEMIDSNYLTHNVTGMPGGFLYTFSLFALFIILLYPLAVKNIRKEI